MVGREDSVILSAFGRQLEANTIAESLLATPPFEDVAYAPQSEEGGVGFRRSRIPLGRAHDIFAAEVLKVS